MPTGYTADVATGKITDFTSFAWLCARAFGAMISLRDDAMEADRPEKFEASDYHAKRLAEARSRVAFLNTMTVGDAIIAHREAQQKRLSDRDEINAKRIEQKARYEAMLEDVRAWNPPTAEHVGLKEFMEKQLVESIDFDCKPVDQYYPDLPGMAEWLADEKKKAHRLCEYHAAEIEKERNRIDERNAWVEALDASLAARDDNTGQP